MIHVRNLKKKYNHVVAVGGVSFSVQKGEVFGLLGPNGAGKTSILECLEGIRHPDGGQIEIAGINAIREAHKLRKVIGVQLQSGALPETITPDEVMRLFCSYQGVATRYDFLDRFGLGQKRTTQFHQLSTGRQRRLSLALAVGHDPQVLFLDEPTAGLDVAARKELHQLIVEMKSHGTTIILATHDMAEAEVLTDRVAILLKGELVAMGSPMDITRSGAGWSKISVQTRDQKLQHTDPTIPGIKHKKKSNNYIQYFSSDTGATVSAIISFIESQEDQLLDLRVERPSLEDRFLELTAE